VIAQKSAPIPCRIRVHNVVNFFDLGRGEGLVKIFELPVIIST
jgi:hypothetical protein